MLPNHILILGSPHTGKLRICDFLSKGKKIDNISNESHGGLILKTELTTKYYTASLSILIDEYPSIRLSDPSIRSDDESKNLSHLNQWYDEFKSSEVKELRDVLDGFIFTINLDTDEMEYIEKALDTITNIRSLLQDEQDNEIFIVIAGISERTIGYEEVEDLVISNGLEFIYFNECGQNEYKDKLGRDRLKEIIESHEWNNMDLNDTTYEQRKLNRMNEMTTSLLGSDDNEPKLDLTDILDKLDIAKQHASKIDDEDAKKQYVNSIIEDIIDSI